MGKSAFQLSLHFSDKIFIENLSFLLIILIVHLSTHYVNQITSSSHMLFKTIVSTFGLLTFAIFLFGNFSNNLIQAIQPVAHFVNSIRLFIFLDAYGVYFDIYSIETNRDLGQLRRLAMRFLFAAQFCVGIYILCVVFPITLTNKVMHALNGNIDNVIEPQGNIYTSSVPKRVSDRSHDLDQNHPKSWIPPVNVQHNFKWKTGDKILDSVYSFFKGSPEEKSYSESFKTCEDQKPVLSEFLMNPTTITILLVAIILIFIQIPNKITKSLVVIIIGTILGLKFTGMFENFDSVHLLDLWYKLPQFNDDLEMEDIEAQGPVDYLPMFSSLLLTGFSGLSGFTPKKSFIDGLLKATKVTEVQTNNVTTALLTVCSKVHDYLNSISQEAAASYFDVSGSCDVKVRNFQKKVYKFCSAFNSGSPESMLHCADVYSELYAEARKLAQEVPKQSYDLRIVTDATTKLLTVYQKITDMEVSVSGERIETVCVILTGAPGVMKGVLNKRLSKVCAIATIPKEWRESFKQDNREFFFNVPTDSFWDTYTNKAWVTIYDDVFQRRDAVADSDSDALKIIKMVNSAPYTLKMAGVAQKNNTFFRSAFLFCTSNIPNYKQLQSVSDFKAVERRMHIAVDVKINKKYCDPLGKLVKEKLPNEFDPEGKNLPNDFWHLSVIETSGNVPSKPKIMTIKQLIQLIVKRYQSHKMNYFVNRKSETKLIAQLSEELGYDWDDEDEEVIIEPQGGTNDYDISFLEPLSNHTEHDRQVWEAKYWNLCDDIGRTDLYGEGFYSAMKIYCEFNDHYGLNKHIDNRDHFFVYLEQEFRVSLTLKRHPLTLRPEWHEDFATPPDSPIVRLKSIYFAFKEFVSENLLFIIAGSLFSAVAIYYLSSFFDTIISAQSVDYKTMGKRSSSRKQIKLSVKAKDLSRVEAQSGVPPNFDFEGLPKFKASDFGERNNQNDVISKLFNKYFFIMYIVEHESENHVTRFGHVTNLRGQIFLVPFHFMFLLDIIVKKETFKGATIVLTTTSGSNRYSLPVEEFMNSFKTSEDAADNDLCLVKLACAQKMSKGAISNFLKVSDFENLCRSTSFATELLGSYQTSNGGISVRSKFTRASLLNGGIAVTANWGPDNYIYNLFETLVYKIKTSKGDCGSLLVASDSNYENRFIMGIHSAGGGQEGYATKTLQEPLIELMDALYPDEQFFVEEEEPPYLKSTGIIEPQGGLQPVYKILPPYTTIDMSRSAINKSKLHGKLPGHEVVGTVPARLKSFYTSEGELIDPLQKAFDKYGKIAPDIPNTYVLQAIESYENLLLENFESKPESRRVLTLKEALHSFDNMNTINSSTSSGFPMNLACETDLKKEYYEAFNSGDEERTEKAYQRIAHLVESVLELYRQMIRPFYAYKQCGKDEPRSMEKFLEFKTRLFAACPFILLLFFRMYFGSFISDYIGANVSVGSAVGVNPYSHDWDSIARRLLSFSQSDDEEAVAAGDQGEFDTRQWTIVHNAISEMINRHYPNATPEENFIRTALYMEITNSRHVFKNFIYIWNSGLPSGNPMTAIINTIYNHITFRICWVVAKLPIKNFNASVYLIVLGDDNSFSTKKAFREVFNEITLVELMGSIGMKYTTELKTVSEFPFRRLDQVEFLKRSFKKDKALNRWIAPLRQEAIFEMLNWTKKGKESDQITLDNINFALRELSLHGKNIFEEWVVHFKNLKATLFPGMSSHGDMPLNFENTYNAVLKEEFYF